MGLLSFFPLQEYIKKYSISTLIETGLGYGTGVKFAQKFKEFHDIHSCEIDTEQANKIKEELKYDYRVHIFAGKSEDYLKFILKDNNLIKEKSVIFFLDSHFPLADLGKANFDDEKNLDIRLPLETELDIIFNLRNPETYKDIILIDDWRIYEKMDFPGGDLENLGLGNLTKYDVSFVKRWTNTHVLNKIKTDTGYLEIIPK